MQGSVLLHMRASIAIPVILCFSNREVDGALRGLTASPNQTWQVVPEEALPREVARPPLRDHTKPQEPPASSDSPNGLSQQLPGAF
eukprot:5674401-Alexandrium_andersonii.AAC.1